MERALRLLLVLSLGGVLPVPASSIAFAQAEDEEDEDEGEIRLRPPVLEPIQVDRGRTGAGAGDERDDDVEEEQEEARTDTESDEELPSPAAADERLDVGGDPTAEPWTTPQTVFEVHGYLRMRGEFQDQFSLGRAPIGSTHDYPFELFIPREDVSLLGGGPAGGCAGARGDPAATCNQRALAYANMRLRIEPAIHLSDDVRIRMQIDVFDNLVMGSTPEGFGVTEPLGRGRGLIDGNRFDSTYVPLTAFSQSQVPPRAGFNSWSDSIMVRRAWAEVRNRGLGELRFGRMGNHWGLGILANGGAGLDADFQSDVDRIMAITRLFGFYFFGAWDFASEGYVYESPVDLRVPFDAVRQDDVDQFTFGFARRSTTEEQEAALQRGDVVINGGLFFVYRTQNLTSEGTRSPLDWQANPVIFRRGFEVFVPDIWVQVLYENLRLEAEAAMLIGTIDNLSLGTMPGFPGDGTNQILSFGAAFEGEYHLLNNQLGIYFYAGFATGDADVEGLVRTTDGQVFRQEPRPGMPDRNLTAFSFHPNYRIDLIFWRTIMRQFGSAYYFRPGLSYDFIRSSFGQLLGARADLIWSRASEPVQTWGNQPDIGLEIDAQVYYRSEDGPDLLDGFYAAIQYGIFFPFGALGYLPNQLPEGFPFRGGQNAQTLRLILGVQY